MNGATIYMDNNATTRVADGPVSRPPSHPPSRRGHDSA